MALEVVLPKVDMDMESGVIATWKVAEGDRVNAGDVLFEMETSKSIMEVESPGSGIIRRLAAVDGTAIAVGTPVAWIEDERPDAARAPMYVGASHRGTAAEAAPSPAGATAQPGEPVTPARSATQPGEPAALARTPTHPRERAAHVASAAPSAANDEPALLRATPYARHLARAAGVDLARVHGSGPRGRVVAADVTAHAPVPHEGAADAAYIVPFSATRRIAAQRLAESVRTAPHFYLTAHVEMTALRAALSERGRALQRAVGSPPTLTVALAFLTARALMRHPMVNASVERDTARLHPHADIGIAMDRDGDLVVPVLRSAETKTLAELTADFARLRDGVRAHTLPPAELAGGTFTLSNLGMHGVDAFTAIINPPQSAILAIGRVVDTPVGRDGQVVLRPLATLSLSSDHRIVDGVTAARFMADLRQSIEHPALE